MPSPQELLDKQARVQQVLMKSLNGYEGMPRTLLPTPISLGRNRMRTNWQNTYAK
jgi:hypothetical protein